MANAGGAVEAPVGIRRTATRREPIIITVESSGESFEAKPLFWRDRNDLGTEIARQYTVMMNGSNAVSVAKSDELGIDTLQWNFDDIDYDKLVHMAYPEHENGAFDRLHMDELIDVLLTALQVNGLGRFDYMIDPSKKDVIDRAMEMQAKVLDDGQKMPSSTDASSTESTPTNSD